MRRRSLPRKDSHWLELSRFSSWNRLPILVPQSEASLMTSGVGSWFEALFKIAFTSWCFDSMARARIAVSRETPWRELGISRSSIARSTKAFQLGSFRTQLRWSRCFDIRILAARLSSERRG